jgi:hypothetical protein
MSSVSVVVPCYNYAHFLRECVESVLAQRGVDVRVLVLDDCSQDDTPRVGAALAAEDPRVEFRRHATNQRHIATYNEGLEWASGDYTVLLSADDLLTPGALARATRVMDAHPEVGFVYGANIRLVTGEPRRPPRTEAPAAPAELWDGRVWLDAICRRRALFIDSPEVVVRTAMYKRHGGYRPELPHTADVEMWLRLASHCDVGRVDADQAYYRVHGQNMHGQLAGSAVRSLEHWRAAFSSYFDHGGAALPGGEARRREAYASLAAQALRYAYAPTPGGPTAARDELAGFAARVAPEVVSPRGAFTAGARGASALEPWARRAVLGVPAYLLRALARDGSRGALAALRGDALGSAFLLGRAWAHLRLVAATASRRATLPVGPLPPGRIVPASAAGAREAPPATGS